MAYLIRQLKESLNGMRLIYDGAVTYTQMKSNVCKKETESMMAFWKNGILFNDVKFYKDCLESQDAANALSQEFDACFGENCIISMERYKNPGCDKGEGFCREYYNIKSLETPEEGVIISTRRI